MTGEILNLARRTLFHCDILIEQCNSWLPPPDYGNYHRAPAMSKWSRVWVSIKNFVNTK